MKQLVHQFIILNRPGGIANADWVIPRWPKRVCCTRRLCFLMSSFTPGESFADATKKVGFVRRRGGTVSVFAMGFVPSIVETVGGVDAVDFDEAGTSAHCVPVIGSVVLTVPEVSRGGDVGREEHVFWTDGDVSSEQPGSERLFTLSAIRIQHMFHRNGVRCSLDKKAWACTCLPQTSLYWLIGIWSTNSSMRMPS